MHVFILKYVYIFKDLSHCCTLYKKIKTVTRIKICFSFICIHDTVTVKWKSHLITCTWDQNAIQNMYGIPNPDDSADTEPVYTTQECAATRTATNIVEYQSSMNWSLGFLTLRPNFIHFLQIKCESGNCKSKAFHIIRGVLHASIHVGSNAPLFLAVINNGSWLGHNDLKSIVW